MRIALVYPPPWMICSDGDPAEGTDGPPQGLRSTDLDADFLQTPYGLLSIAAQALRAGHQVKVFNLSSFAWADVERLTSSLDADVWGLSCFTANRRGVALTAKAIRRHHPTAHITLGGPHVTALARQTLERWSWINSVVMGEGEATFLDLVDRIAHEQPLANVPGIAYRQGNQVHVGKPRDRVADLDSLADPHAYFDTHLVLTSRGCPGKCTYCAKNAVWGSGYRTHSVDYVVGSLRRAIDRLPVRMLLFKDDTFTANRKRAIEICQRIREERLNFVWSCDTRADVFDDQLAREMRLAGCQRISFGVESGSPTILRNIQKNLKPDDIARATQIAKRVGLQVRYYMMIGNRGETLQTFGQSLDFVRSASPHQAIFACLSIYPGTKDYLDLCRSHVIDPDIFFTDDFLELKLPFDASDQDTAKMSEWFYANLGVRTICRDSVEDCQRVVDQFEGLGSAHLDLAGAYYRQGQFDKAAEHARRALDLDHPLPALPLNYLACIAASAGQFDQTLRLLDQAQQRDPWHPVLIQNMACMQRWLDAHGSTPPALVAGHDFELIERTLQPVLPGPLAADFARWET